MIERVEAVETDEAAALAIRAKDNPALMADLWDAVQGNLAVWVRRRMISRFGQGTRLFDADDLVQSGYLALVDTVADYDPDRGSFWAILHFHVLRQFYEVTGGGSHKDKRPHLFASSLDDMLTVDGDELEFNMPDPRAAAAFERVEDDCFRAQLRVCLDECMADMTPEQAAIIRERYYNGKDRQDVAAETRQKIDHVRWLEEKAMLYLLRPKNTQRLRSFMYPDLYVGNGLAAFRRRGERGFTSRVEALAMEELAKEGL